MTVRILDFRGDGTYYLADRALELEGLRDGGPGSVLGGTSRPAPDEQLRRLLARPLPDGRRALDVIFAAPKPLSVLLATERPAIARRLVALHEQSVNAAFDYLTADDAGTRHQGVDAVAFTHGVNRLLDPHLHTHVLTGACEHDGTPLDARRLRWRGAAADAIFTASLRAGLPRAAGRSAWVGRSGATLVEGVDHALVAATSTPRRRDGSVERGVPKRHPTREEVATGWAAQVASCASIGDLPSPPAAQATIDEHRFARELGDGLVADRDVVRAWARAATFGAPPAEVLGAVGLVAPALQAGARRAAVAVRDDVGVRVLGPRPLDPAALGHWREDRDALGRYLEGGHRLSHLLNARGAPAVTRLAIAQFEADRTTHAIRRGVVRDAARGRGSARELS